MHTIRWSGLLAAVLIAVAVGIVEAPRTMAECSRLDYWPRMREAAPSARRVVIGTVRDVEVERRRPGDAREVTSFTLEVSTDVKGSGPHDICLPGVATNEGCITSGSGCSRACASLWPSGALCRPVIGKHVWFSADADDGSGREPWLSDGTAEGTKLVADIAPDGASNPTGFRGRVAFTADDGVHGPELWLSDVANGDTRLVLDIRPGPDGSEPSAFVVPGCTR